jgi:hypothetical protein
VEEAARGGRGHRPHVRSVDLAALETVYHTRAQSAFVRVMFVSERNRRKHRFRATAHLTYIFWAGRVGGAGGFASVTH